MKLPGVAAPGNPISASDWNALVQEVKSLRLLGGPGVRVARSSVGTTITVIGQPVGGSTVITHPFKVSAQGSTVLVRSGSVNDVIPTGISPTAQGLTAAGTWRIYIDCTLDASGSVTAAAIGVTSGAQPADSDTHAYITIATATVVSTDSVLSVSDVFQLVTHSLRFYACGRVVDGGSVTTRGTYNFWGV